MSPLTPAQRMGFAHLQRISAGDPRPGVCDLDRCSTKNSFDLVKTARKIPGVLRLGPACCCISKPSRYGRPMLLSLKKSPVSLIWYSAHVPLEAECVRVQTSKAKECSVPKSAWVRARDVSLTDDDHVAAHDGIDSSADMVSQSRGTSAYRMISRENNRTQCGQVGRYVRGSFYT